VLKAGVHRLRVSDCESEALDLFRRPAGKDRNGTILGAATIRPIGLLGQNATNSSGHQHEPIADGRNAEREAIRCDLVIQDRDAAKKRSPHLGWLALQVDWFRW